MSPGCSLGMASLKRWSASVTSRSLTESGRGWTLRTASTSTIQKWPERSPLSSGQTEGIPGLVASEMECDKTGCYQWTVAAWTWKSRSRTMQCLIWEYWLLLLLFHASVICTVLVLIIWLPNLPKVLRLSLHWCFFHLHLIVNTGLKSENEPSVMESVSMREENYINTSGHTLSWPIWVNI